MTVAANAAVLITGREPGSEEGGAVASRKGVEGGETDTDYSQVDFNRVVTNPNKDQSQPSAKPVAWRLLAD